MRPNQVLLTDCARKIRAASNCGLLAANCMSSTVMALARSKLDTKRIERTLKVVASARNWNTCQRLLNLLEEVEAQAN